MQYFQGTCIDGGPSHKVSSGLFHCSVKLVLRNFRIKEHFRFVDLWIRSAICSSLYVCVDLLYMYIYK